MESARKLICDSVNSLLFSMNLMIWSSSSKTCQCFKLSGTEGLKMTSILHKSRSGPSQGCRVEEEITKAYSMWLSSRGMASSDTILKDFERD